MGYRTLAAVKRFLPDLELCTKHKIKYFRKSIFLGRGKSELSCFLYNAPGGLLFIGVKKWGTELIRRGGGSLIEGRGLLNFPRQSSLFTIYVKETTD